MFRLKCSLAFLFVFALALCMANGAHAQLLEGLQLGTQPLPSGSRGMAMGGNLISAADGVDALDYNPAAIAPIMSREITLSIFNRDHASTANFLNTSSNATLSQMSLSSLGIAAPYATTQGHFAIGISYDRVRDYTSTYSFSAVNPNSSYFNTQGFIQDPHSYGVGNRNYLGNTNLAYALGLTYDVPDSGAYTLTTPFTGGMLQSGTVTTQGGLSAVRIGAGIDLAEGISAGATVNILFGTYDFTDNYQEKNVNGIVTDTGTAAPAGFQVANITTTLHQDQSGGSVKFGLLVNKQIVKFGLTLETPQVIHINENSIQTGNSQFANVGPYNSNQMSQLPVYVQTYDVVTPIRLGAGASVHLLGLVGSASVSYADMSQLQFSNSSVDMSAMNTEARDSLRGVLSYQLGAEYTFPLLGLSLRAGYSFEPSPYKNDPANYGVSAISGGLGFDLSKSVSLEAALRHAMYHTNHAIYNDLTPQGTPVSANIYDDSITRDDISVTFSYRY